MTSLAQAAPSITFEGLPQDLTAAERAAFDALLTAYARRLAAFNARHGVSAVTGRPAGSDMGPVAFGVLARDCTLLGPAGTPVLVWDYGAPICGRRGPPGARAWSHAYGAKQEADDRRWHRNEPARECCDCARVGTFPEKIHLPGVAR